MWYAAHAVIAIRFKEGLQSEFPAWENIFIIEASTDEEAQLKAEARARKDGGDGGLTWDGHPAQFVFWGIRKLVLCYEGEKQPSDGTEITYNRLVFATENSLQSFASGGEAHAMFDDEEPIDE